jgi:hypothetical protein
VSERAWLLAICLAELGTMLVFQRASTRASALAGPLAVGFKEFSPRKPVV